MFVKLKEDKKTKKISKNDKKHLKNLLTFQLRSAIIKKSHGEMAELV